MSLALTAVAKIVSSDADIVSGPCVVYNFGLCSGADAAVVEFRDGSATGALRWKLGVNAANTSAGEAFQEPVRFLKSCHVVTLTGTSPVAQVAIDLPRANQESPS